MARHRVPPSASLAMTGEGSRARPNPHRGHRTGSNAHSTVGPLERPDGLWSELERLERTRIIEALAATAGNQSAAARRLGISRATLIKRIERYGLPRPKKR